MPDRMTRTSGTGSVTAHEWGRGPPSGGGDLGQVLLVPALELLLQPVVDRDDLRTEVGHGAFLPLEDLRKPAEVIVGQGRRVRDGGVGDEALNPSPGERHLLLRDGDSDEL